MVCMSSTKEKPMSLQDHAMAHFNKLKTSLVSKSSG